jgi:fumarate hydratase subunit alpha
VANAGPNACPPLIVGVGIGGNFDKCALLAKKSLLRHVGAPNPDPEWAAREQELLEEINKLGVGPMGLGGTVTALAVHVEVMGCHITALPVAVNIECHSHRHKEATL